MKITINLTDAEAKALAHVAYSPTEWVENVTKVRAKAAIKEIFDKEVERMLADPNIESVPADKDAVVLAANIKTAKQIQDELDSNES